MDLAMLIHFDNIKTVKTVSLIWFMIILPMVETMGYGRWQSDKAEDFIRKFLRPTLHKTQQFWHVSPNGNYIFTLKHVLNSPFHK
jgi:hypothetical protein